MDEIVDSKYLVKKYIPELFNLLVKKGYNKWAILDNRIDSQLKSKIDVNTNLIRLLLEIESQNSINLKAFTDLINEIIHRVLIAIPSKEKKIWEAINGKFDNIEDWNYLNPIGELSALDKVLRKSDFELIEIEAAFPNGKTKDYLFQRKKDKSKQYVEIVNIHIPKNEINEKKIKRMIIYKLNSKIQKEIYNIIDSEILNQLCFFPIVWYLDTDFLKNEYTFLSDFKNTCGAKFGVIHKSMGICTYFKVDGKYEFAEASSIIEFYKI